MANVTADRLTPRLGDHTLVELPDFPMKAAKTVYEGLMVGLTSGGFLVDAGDGTCAQVIGIADKFCDNSAGADGAISCPVRRGAHKFDNSTANPVVQGSMYLTTAKAEDNHTVCVAAGTGVAIKGRLLRLDADGVYVEFF
jgi:hypothetical protein